MGLVLNNWIQITPSAGWTARTLHRVVSDGEYMYMTGGYNPAESPTKFSDVWRSADGVTWELLTADGGYGRRSGHGFIYTNSRFFILGGSDDTGTFLNDVWTSTDGVTWTQVYNVLFPDIWSARHEFTVVSLFGNDLTVIGGFNGSIKLNDVWYATGVSNWWEWVQLTGDAFGVGNGIREHASAVFRSKAWVFGGDDSETADSNLVYSSSLGDVWAAEGAAAWTGRVEHQTVVATDGSEVAIVGGRSGSTFFQDVWRSTDGINWTEVVQDNAPPKRSDFALVSHRGRSFIIGGSNAAGTFSGDVWASDYELFCTFTGDVLTGLNPLEVVFTPEATGSPTSYLWDFGDGYSSTDEVPTHIYESPGTYDVSLTVANSDNTYTSTRRNYIVIGLDFSGDPLTGGVPLEVAFSL